MVIAPEDMKVCEIYKFSYKTWEGKLVTNQGEYMGIVTDEVAVWINFRLIDNEGKTYVCPFDYGCLKEIIKV